MRSPAMHRFLAPVVALTVFTLLPSVASAAPNLALGKRAAASSSEDRRQRASRANDGSAATRWASARHKRRGQWWRVDLGAVRRGRRRVRHLAARAPGPLPRADLAQREAVDHRRRGPHQARGRRDDDLQAPPRPPRARARAQPGARAHQMAITEVGVHSSAPAPHPLRRPPRRPVRSPPSDRPRPPPRPAPTASPPAASSPRSTAPSSASSSTSSGTPARSGCGSTSRGARCSTTTARASTGAPTTASSRRPARAASTCSASSTTRRLGARVVYRRRDVPARGAGGVRRVRPRGGGPLQGPRGRLGDLERAQPRPVLEGHGRRRVHRPAAGRLSRDQGRGPERHGARGATSSAEDTSGNISPRTFLSGVYANGGKAYF